MGDTTHIQVAVGRAARRRRETICLSQEELADRAGLHRTYVGSFERGERNISVQNLMRVADALGIALSALIAEAEEDRSKLRRTGA